MEFTFPSNKRVELRNPPIRINCTSFNSTSSSLESGVWESIPTNIVVNLIIFLVSELICCNLFHLFFRRFWCSYLPFWENSLSGQNTTGTSSKCSFHLLPNFSIRFVSSAAYSSFTATVGKLTQRLPNRQNRGSIGPSWVNTSMALHSKNQSNLKLLLNVHPRQPHHLHHLPGNQRAKGRTKWRKRRTANRTKRKGTLKKERINKEKFGQKELNWNSNKKQTDKEPFSLIELEEANRTNHLNFVRWVSSVLISSC